MIKSNKEAEQLCEKYGVDYSVHPQIVVTANGNIYLTGNIDPKDDSEKFYLHTEDVVLNEVTDVETVEVKPKKKK